MPSSNSAINRANAQHSTGPRSIGKHTSSLNAISHGLTSQSPVPHTDDPDAYNRRALGQERSGDGVSVGLKLSGDEAVQGGDLLPANLSVHGHRLSRHFHKGLDYLREIQATRRETEARDLRNAAAILQLYKHKGIPCDPAGDGFVFSITKIEDGSQ